MDTTAFRLPILAGLILTGACLCEPAQAQRTTTFSGKAAYYDPDYKGKTASGEPYDGTRFTAAHKTLPFGTQVRVIDVKTGRSTVVTINDRGPFTKGRDIDLSLAAAKAIGMIERGVIAIRAEILGSPKR